MAASTRETWLLGSAPNLVAALDGAEVIKPARDWPKPSDHAPVVVTLALPA